jgi:hypothetical protein
MRKEVVVACRERETCTYTVYSTYYHVFVGVRDLKTGFGFMTGFFAHLYNLLLHFTNHCMTHYVFSSPSSSTAVSRDSLSYFLSLNVRVRLSLQLAL